MEDFRTLYMTNFPRKLRVTTMTFFGLNWAATLVKLCRNEGVKVKLTHHPYFFSVCQVR